MQEGVEIITKAIRGTVSLDSDELRKFLLKNEGKMIVVTFDTFKREKSNAQLRYYWGAIISTLVDLGWSKQESHIYLKKNCNPIESHDPLTGEVETIPGGISDMSLEGLADYIDRCIKHLGENGIEVPTPDQFWNAKRVKK